MGGLTLPFAGNVSTSGIGFEITNSGSGLTSAAVAGKDTGLGVGVLGNGTIGVLGSSTAGDAVVGQSVNGTGVDGSSQNSNGVHGDSNSPTNSGVWGENIRGGFGVSGSTNSATAAGVWGDNPGGDGIRGTSGTGRGVIGRCTSGIGVLGNSTSGEAVVGVSDSGTGVHGTSANTIGVQGDSDSSGFTPVGRVGVWGDCGKAGIGVLGSSGTGGIGLFANSAAGHGQAGFFEGSVMVTGALNKAGGGFRIDHPLEPAHKYLNHSFVESSERKNVYDGMAVLGSSGEATIELPSWFETINQDFRYQLTPVGGPAPNLYIANKLSQNRLKIGGGIPGLEVSWQVTGIRRDAWARAHPIVVEEIKSEQTREYYLHPELYGERQERAVSCKLIQHAEVDKHEDDLVDKAATSGYGLASEL
jgi:hypothetical protein